MSTDMISKVEIDPAITLTEAAAQRVRAFMAKQGGQGLHLDVRKTGCSGWAYELEIAKASAGPDEIACHDQGIEIIVTEAAMALMRGTVIDFVHDGLVAEFRFKNPNVTAECGCGESFTVNP